MPRSPLFPLLLACAVGGSGLLGCGGASSGDSTSNTTADSTATSSSFEAIDQTDPQREAEMASGDSDVVHAPNDIPSPDQQVESNEVFDITFDDLKLEMPVGTLFDSSMLTPRVAELDGKNVRLRGFIFAGGVFQSSGIKSFPFVMNTQCKFGPQGLAYCVILVELEEGVTTNFTTYPITVEGKLTVRPFNANGFTWSVYHMRGDKVY